MNSSVVYCVALLLAIASQAAGKRRSLVGPAARSKHAHDNKILSIEEQKKQLVQKLIHSHGHSNKSPSFHSFNIPSVHTTSQDAKGDERVAKPDLFEFVGNPVMKDPVSSELQPGDLQGTRSLYAKLKKLEKRAVALEGTFKLQAYLKMQLDKSEFLIREHGANNILRMLQSHDPTCHNVAHQVGRAAVRITRDITYLLEMCDSGCNVGCFHGVIMGLVIDSYNGDFTSIPTEEKKTYVSGVLRKMCDEDTIGKSRVGTCIHGVGHAAVVASDGHDLKEGMEICMAAFYDDRQKQHHCGTGVSMHKKGVIKQDAFHVCSRLPLPASCFEYAWAGALGPKKKKSGDTTALITFGKKESAKCTGLATVELQEACLYGLGTIVGRHISEEEKRDPKMARMKARMSSAVLEVCMPLDDEAVRKACMLGFMRYANRWFQPEATHVICFAVSDNIMPDCIESMATNGGYSYMDHFAIQELPLDRVHRIP